MKRFIVAVLICSMLLCSCSNNKVNEDLDENTQSIFETLGQTEENTQLNPETQIQTEENSQTNPEKESKKDKNNQMKSETVSQTEKKPVTIKEIHAVWISCFELPDATKGEKEFKNKTETIFRNLKKKDYNTVFVHVRPYADSIYPSEIFPWSKHCCKGKNPNFDPLKIIVRTAKKYNISIHAWINPFRINTSGGIESLPKNSPAISMMEKNPSDVAILPNGIYFNPASTAVHKLIYSGVEEILKNYDVDGIHIDDYFYPTTDAKIDKKEYDEYKKSGGKLNLKEWRKSSVSAFVSGLYELTHKYNKILSVSPSGSLFNNEEKMYADIPLWMGEEGYLDMIIPQLYYGFENEKYPFEELMNDWAKIKRNENVKLVGGLAQYKRNKTDSNAGATGKNEWIENEYIIDEQKKLLKGNKAFSGFADFSYSYIFKKSL